MTTLSTTVASDSVRFPLAAACLAVGAVCVAGCGGVNETPVAARTDGFEISEDELARWTPFLEEQRELRARLRKTDNRRQELLRIIALIRLVPKAHGDLMPSDLVVAGHRDLEARGIRSAYVDAVLRPRVRVDEDEVRAIFEGHRQNFQKPEGVRVLEIFRWAPADLVELRRQRSEELETLKASIQSREDFERLAVEHSDATSAIKGGRIGTIHRGQVTPSLETVLFSEAVGLTDVVSSDSGVYLFYIIDRLPPRTNEFEDVADGIRKTLTRRRLERLVREDTERLERQYGLDIIPASDTDDGRPRLRIGDEVMTADELLLPAKMTGEALERPMKRRGLTILHERELNRLGVTPDPVDPVEVAWLEYRLTWPRLVVAELDVDPPHPQGQPQQRRGAPAVERWTFDLLRIPAGDGATTWNAAFRASLEVEPEAGLDSFREHLAARYGVSGRVERFRQVTGREAGPMGPEIHTTLKKRLGEGERSRPLMIEDRAEVVVIHLHAKRVDAKASAEATRNRDRRLHRRQLEQRLEAELLRRHSFEAF